MKVLLCGQWDAAEQALWLQALQSALPEVTWLDLPGARREPEAIEAAVVANPMPGSLQGLPNLRFIQSLWAGVDRLLADASVPPHIPLARMVDPAMTAAMVESALWATLALHRGFFTYGQQQAQSLWKQLPQKSASDMRVLVLGYGEMGRGVAQALAAQGYAVQAWRRSADEAVDSGVSVCGGKSALWQLLPRAHIVMNLLPLHDATRGLLNEHFFAAMSPGASVVNFGRGAHVVDEALLAALDSGHIGHAVLDVFQQEPLPAEHRYWQHPRVTLLPHAAALTDARSAAGVVAANLDLVMRGGMAAHLVSRRAGY